MTLRLELRIDGDSRGAQRAVDDTRKSVVQLGQESRKPAGNPLQPIEDGAGRAGNSVGSLRMIFRTLGREAAIVGGPMAGIIGQVGTLTVGAGRLGVAMTVGALSVAAIAAAAYKAVTAYSALEQQQAQNANVMATMRSGSGQTIQSLAALTRELAESGTQSVESIREAETALLRFKVGGSETFATILRLSKDVAANGFASMKDAAIALAVAIEDPAKGFDKLKEIGVNLSATQQQLVLDFYATGQRVKGVQTILNEASRQFSGSDARSADTLGASWGRLTKSTGTYFEQVGGWITQQGGLKAILDATAKAWDNATQGRFTFNPNVFGLPPTPAEQPAMPKADRLPRPTFRDTFDQMKADLDAANAPIEQQVASIKKVIGALEVEARTAGMTATELRIYNEQSTAGVRSNETFASSAAVIAQKIQEIGNKNFMRDLTAESIKQESALRAETATVTMAAGEAKAYQFVQERLAAEKAKGTDLSNASIAALMREGSAIGDLTQRLDDLRTVKTTGVDVVSSGIKDLRNELQNGASGWDALKTSGLNALNRISDKLTDMAVNNLFNKALGGSSGAGGILGIVASLFGGSSQPVGVVGGAGSMVVPTFDSGGFTGAMSTRAIAGVVHGREFVFDAEKTARFRPLFEAIHNGRVPGYAGGGYVGPASAPPLLSGGGSRPIVNIFPAAAGETFDVRQNGDGSLDFIGRMMDDRLTTFSRKHMPQRVHDIMRDPRAR